MFYLFVNVALSRLYLMLEELLIRLWLIDYVFELILLILLFDKCVNRAKYGVVALTLTWLTIFVVMVILNEILKRTDYKVSISREVRWLVSMMLFWNSCPLLVFLFSIVRVFYFLYGLLNQALIILLLQLIIIGVTAIRKCIR